MKKSLKFKKWSQNVGFTLVELVIVIAIVIILSVVSVPIYRGYVDKAKMSEAYALVGAVMSAQKAYYSEYGNFRKTNDEWTNFDTVLGIDVRGNKYFTWFKYWKNADVKSRFDVATPLPEDLADSSKTYFCFSYNKTRGGDYFFQ